jgi:hypothetical protein
METRIIRNLQTTGILRLALDAVDIGAGDDVPCFHVAIHALREAVLLAIMLQMSTWRMYRRSIDGIEYQRYYLVRNQIHECGKNDKRRL